MARQQRKKPDPWPPQATWALKIALLGAHAEHVPRGALEELRHSTLLLRPLSVLCSSHLQVVPRLCGGIEQHVCSPIHNEILVHKYHSVRHDQREPSAVSAHDEDETDAGIRRPARHEARLHHQEHQRSAIGAPPRPSINMPRLDSAVLQRLRRSGQLPNENARRDRNGVFNQHCSDACSSAGLRFARVTMRCRGWPRGFAQRLLFFSL